MAFKVGYLVHAKDFTKTRTSASAYLFGATGQSYIACGPESNYLTSNQKVIGNRPTILLAPGQRYVMIGQKPSLQKLCTEKYDQLIKKAPLPKIMSPEAKMDWSQQAIEIRYDKVEPKFSEVFGTMAAKFAFGVFGPLEAVPLLADGLLEVGDRIGEKHSQEFMLSFCVSYGVNQAKMEKQGQTKVYRTPYDEVRLAYVNAHIF